VGLNEDIAIVVPARIVVKFVNGCKIVPDRKLGRNEFTIVGLIVGDERPEVVSFGANARRFSQDFDRFCR
jgi:hypothetical protein